MKNILVITDPGLDPDDVVTAWMLANLHREGQVNLLGAVANYSPAAERALLLKGVFDSLGVDVYVGVGTNCNTSHAPRDYEFDFPFGEYGHLSNGHDLIHWLLMHQEDKSITLLLVSGLTDIKLAQDDFGPLLGQKLKEVYIMGGASWDGDRMVVDPTASNNRFDPTLDAQSVYDWFPAAGVPLNVLSRHAAYSASVAPNFYDYLAEVNSVGAYLQRIQSESIKSLWHHVRFKPESERQNATWFANRFCGMDSLDPNTDDPWPYLQSFSLYDPLTLAWIMRPGLFAPQNWHVNGTPCAIAGVSSEHPGVLDPEGAISFIKSCLH